MQCTLMTNTSERNELNKSIRDFASFECRLIDNTSVVNPSLLIEFSGNISVFNYAHIPSFNRYYYITDIVSVTNNLWRVNCHTDVLMSFKSQILGSMAIVEETTVTEISRYLKNSVWVATVKDRTEVLNFPTTGFLNEGKYILITAGGL